MELSRRDFLKVSAGAAGAAGLVLLNSPSLALAGASDDDVGMLIDVTKCISCWGCYAACKECNGLPDPETVPDPSDPPALASDTWTTMYTLNNGSMLTTPRKMACNHCTDAACVKVCPTGALSYNSLGIVQYDKSKCSGCGYCSEFCPFGVPQLERNGVSGDAIMYKCTLCKDRIADGEEPACAAACPTGAIKYGKRSELLAEGKQRVETYNAADTSVTHSLYGENELGGLHIMYVLNDTAETYGLPDDPDVSPAILIRDILKWVTIGGAGAMLAGFGFNYLVARKNLANLPSESEEEEEAVAVEKEAE